MSLQFIIGSSGTGKTTGACRRIIGESQAEPFRKFYVIVPEQFTMQTQKDLCEMHPAGGILNIDVLSFQRLAYRIFEETGGDTRRVLEDTGKSMVLMKVAQAREKELPYLGKKMDQPGCLDEAKSLISELMQYGIHPEELSGMLEGLSEESLLYRKLSDLAVLYGAFDDYLRERYLTSEQVLEALLFVLPLSENLKGSILLLDGFTGFTPVQTAVIRQLLALCSQVRVSVSMDASLAVQSVCHSHHLFYMGYQMISSLSALSPSGLEIIRLEHSAQSRFKDSPSLQFLEENLFRYRKRVWPGKEADLSVFEAKDPLSEVEEAARQIHALVRGGLRYGEIAVISGNPELYGDLAEQVFAEAKIPCFIDRKHALMLNPFVEFLRSGMEMAVTGYGYESVFRFLRSGMTDLLPQEIDLLENYCRAMGIRGRKRWEAPFTRRMKGQGRDELELVNDYRQAFLEETQILRETFSRGRQSVRSWCTGLYEYMRACRIYEKLKKRRDKFHQAGDKELEKEYEQIYGAVLSILDKMVEILGEEKVSGPHFRQLLETGLSKTKVGLIPPSLDEVLVGDMLRSRLKQIRVLLFLGVNEGSIPQAAKGGGFLTGSEREFFKNRGIELAPGPGELIGQQRYYLYLNLTKPSNRLILSYSLSGPKGEKASPAWLIGQLLSLFPCLKVESERDRSEPELPGPALGGLLPFLSEGEKGFAEPKRAELLSWYLRDESFAPLLHGLIGAACACKPADSIGEAVAKALYGEVPFGSATRLERYCACAYEHFLTYGLRLSKREEFEFLRSDLGTLMHQALESYARTLAEKKRSWTELEESERNDLIDACLLKLTGDYGNGVLSSSARGRYQIERMRRILRRTVWVLTEHLMHGDFVPEGTEVRSGGGRIDRVDTLVGEKEVYVRVIDYKTGSTSFRLLYVFHGLQLQLLLYLNGAIEGEKKRYPGKEILPGGAFYYHVKDPLIEGSEGMDEESWEKAFFSELKLSGLVSDNQELLMRMDSSLRSLPVSKSPKGVLSSRSGALTSQAKFQDLNDFVLLRMEKARQEILSGNAAISPYELGSDNACSFCPMKKSCSFDSRIPGYRYRRLALLKGDALWAEIRKEVQENGTDMDE